MVHKSFKSKSRFVKGDRGTFYEDGTIVIEGKKFSYGGSFLGLNKKTGKLGGVLYGFPKTGEVGTWDGSKKVKAEFGKEWQSNMGDLRQTVKFKFNNKNFVGTFFKSGSDLVSVMEV